MSPLLVLLDSTSGDDDPIYRTEVEGFNFEYQFYVGGQYERASHDNLLVGMEYNPLQSTTLSADLDETSTQVAVVSTTGFDLGTIMVHPHTDESLYEEYELIAYENMTSTLFQDITRGVHLQDPALQRSFKHSEDSVVAEWVQVTNRILTLSIGEDVADGISTWRATLNGVQYNEKLLARDNSVLAMVRYMPLSEARPTDWTPWRIAWLGYIKDSNATDDYQALGSWTAQVEGVSQYVASSDIPAQQFGIVDVAENKTVLVSSYVADPELAANTGEYIGSPELGGSQIVDGDGSTLWISYDEPSSSASKVDQGFQIAEVFIADPQDGVGPWWIELFNASSDDLRPFNERTIANKHTKWKDITWQNEDGPPTTRTIVAGDNLTFRFTVSKVQSHGYVIVTKDAARFKERWNVGSGTMVYDWDKLVNKGALGEGKFEPDSNGDFLMLGWMGNVTSIVWFGDITPYDFKGNGDGSGWTGATVDIPDRGCSIARDPYGNDGTSAASWDDNVDAPTPGYFRTGTPEWFEIDLGQLNVLTDGVLADDEFDEVALSDTLGIRVGPSQVKIDAELITYQTVDRASHKLLTLTRPDPVEHPDESPVVPYEDYMEKDMHLVKGFSWFRRIVLDAITGMPIVPKNFDIYVSDFASPPHFDSWGNDWRDYWTRRCVVRNNEATYWDVAFEPERIRHVLMTILDMSDDGRAKINTFNAWSATTHIIDYDGGSWYEDELIYSGDIVKFILVNHFGLHPENFIMTDRGNPFKYVPTTKTRAMDIIRDLCVRTGCTVKFHKDNTVEHRFDPFYPLASLPDVFITWDRTNVRDMAYSKPYQHNVSQVLLFASNEATGDQFEVAFPGAPLSLGSEKRIVDSVLGSIDDAAYLARMMFFQESGLPEVNLTPKGMGDWITTLQRHIVNWDIDEDGLAILDRDFIVNGVSLTIEFGAKDKWKTWNLSVTLLAMTF